MPDISASVISLPKIGNRLQLPHLQGAGDSHLLAQIALRQQQCGQPLCIITESALAAQRLFEEIAWFAPTLNNHLLPDWETLPYDMFSPHHDLVSARLSALHHVLHRAYDVLIVPVTTALYRLAPADFLAAYTFFLKQGDTLDLPAFRGQMTLAGYTHVTQVLAPGEYSVRGGLIDLFAMGSPLPFRIDLLDTEIESIRTFDVDTQRSIYPVKEIRLLPAHEFPFDEAGRTHFRGKFREAFEGDPSKSRTYKDVSKGVAPAGIEYYLPLFFEKTATLFDYLGTAQHSSQSPTPPTIVLHHDVGTAIAGFWRDADQRYQLLRGDPDRPLLPPHDLFLSEEDFFVALKNYSRIDIPSPSFPQVHDVGRIMGGARLWAQPGILWNPVESRRRNPPNESAHTAEGATLFRPTSALPSLQIDRRAAHPAEKLLAFIAEFTQQQGRVLILAESLGRREMLLEHLHQYGLQPVVSEDYADFMQRTDAFMLGVAPLQNGFILQPPASASSAFITENELYASHLHGANKLAARRSKAASATETMLRDLSEVKPGDPVVHEHHGIGRYLGLTSMNLGEGETEFLSLQYDGGDKLYVPVAQLDLISRYSGASPEGVALAKLGSGQWEKAKRKAMGQARDAAAELLNLYAQRAARAGHAFKLNPQDYDAFAEGFGFEETPDQAAAINAVIADLTSGKPMDRLICGDVGFGKTEVALRAAFVAVADGKQVAVLVPTTLLAEQHFQNFSDRFGLIANLILKCGPIKIAELSRFRSAKEQNDALAKLATGQIDIVIGTHKLLQKSVQFKNLGLVIIDEEHRFGVQQKETLKKMRAEVDVLTLTATPIPRTLGMSLEGLRDFSVIATAPARRLAIKTFVSRFSEGLIREACLRELKRGGQIYFLHNEVQTIANMRDKLVKLLPEARIAIAHGQQPERELERVMRDFYHQRFNVLLCSTIIETGIDVPTANTILINRADKFGLAQLHQLRGRVGRSHHQAYAYLLTPDEEGIGTQAKKRLEAIAAMEDLGAGFYLAMHDLEIRGAGEVLGEQQSGEIHKIGFNLYAQMLDAAVKSLKAGHEPDMAHPLGVATEINLHAPSLLPEDYCSDVHERLVLYKRLAHCEGDDALDDMQQELVDRFGLLPDAARALLHCHRLRLAAKPLGIKRIDAGADHIQIHFIPNPPVDAAKIIKLIQSGRDYQLAGPDRLKIKIAIADVGARVAKIKTLLQQLK